MSGELRPEDIEALIERFQASDCTEIHVRFEGFELQLSTDAEAGGAHRVDPAPSRPPAAPSAAKSTPSPTAGAAPSAAPAVGLEGLEIVRAPYQGLFYRAPKPGDSPFVEVGAVVGPDSDLCLVEVMKLFTAVRAGTSGKVVKILASDGAMVGGGQPLFAIDPRG
jgi:acetyl-CoA carboxylase biotin carboxyl carrier protein